MYGRCDDTNSNGEYTVSALEGSTYGWSSTLRAKPLYLSQTQNGVSVTTGSTTGGVAPNCNREDKSPGVATDAVDACGRWQRSRCAPSRRASGGGNVRQPHRARLGQRGQQRFAHPRWRLHPDQGELRLENERSRLLLHLPDAGKLTWALFFKNADVGFADSLGLSLQANGVAADAASTQAIADVARKHKSKGCKKGTIKHHGKCVHILVPFAAGSQSVAAGSVEVKVHAGSKAIKALKAGHTLHVSGTFIFQSAFGGPAIAKQESAVVRLPKKQSKGHGKGKRR